MSTITTCPRCGGVVTVWADRSDGVTVNFHCPNETCRAGKGPWDIDPPTVMVTYTAQMTGAYVARCPQCDRVCAYWDEDDLDENGDLLCYCDGDES